MGEVKDGIQLVVSLIDICEGIFFARQIGFSNCIYVIKGEGLLVQFFKELMHPRTVYEILGAGLESFFVGIVLDRINL